MTVGSLFSGIGGFDLGFERAGFRTSWRCEIEPFCQKVLINKLPSATIYDDVRGIGKTVDHVDVLVGGFPCQDLSVAGKRGGLHGERSGLFFEFVRIIRALQPRWWVIENVPGFLSSANGRDFAVALNALDDCGYVGSWRVLDSQFFGLAQRRERVFLVGHLGGLTDGPQTVLFESASGRGDSPSSLQAGENITGPVAGGAYGTGRRSEDDPNLVAYTLPSVHRGVGNGHNTNYIAATLNSGGNNGGFRTEPGEHLVAHTLTGTMHKRHDEDTDTLIASPITASAGHHGHSSPRGDGRDNLVASFAENQRGELLLNDTAGALKVGGGKPGQGYPAALDGAGVRRLTPLECERLQGFPDGWTCLCGEGWHGSRFCKCSDSPRYRALGNAVSVPVAEWIARRILDAEANAGDSEAARAGLNDGHVGGSRERTDI